jgi:hypothetical protein
VICKNVGFTVAAVHPFGVEPTYCNLGIEHFPLGDDTSLVHSLFSGEGRVLDRAAFALLLGCRQFKTIAQHTSALAQSSNLEKNNRAISAELNRLVHLGLLTFRNDLISFIKELCTSRSRASISTICIPTRDRPSALATAVDSFANHTLNHARRVDFVIADDSDLPFSIDANVSALRKLSRKWDIELRYAGANERLTYARQLREYGEFPPELIEFCLRGLSSTQIRPGAPRNLLLLDTLDELVLSVDDDSVCELVTIPGSSSSLRLTSRHDPTAFWFPDDVSGTFEGTHLWSTDFLSAHESLLGADVPSAACKAEEDDRLELDEFSAAIFSALRRAGGGRIPVTSAGIWGDCAMQSNLYYLVLEGHSLVRLTKSADTYRNAMSSRQLLRGVTTPTIGKDSFCMSFNLGLDNRYDLPPFMPVSRNEDGLFGVTLARCLDDAYFGFLPCALRHAPPETRVFSEMNSALRRIGTNDWMSSLISTYRFEPGYLEPKKKMKRLGQYLVDVSSLPNRDFAEFSRNQMLRIVSRRLLQMERRILEAHNPSPYWVRDMKSCAENLRQSLVSEHYLFPHDAASGPGNSCETMREIVRLYGQLIYFWPDITETARTLQTKGIRPSVPLKQVLSRTGS